MPISRPDAIPLVGEIIWGKAPKSILDIGVGFGMWGTLFRAWTDIRLAELKPERYDTWETVIDGIEIHAKYETDLWYQIYDEIFIGDALTLLSSPQPPEGMFTKGPLRPRYDHIHLGDVLEHFNKTDGHLLLELCHQRLTPGGSITVVTPNGYRPQDPVLDNAHEAHLCGWSVGDFKKLNAIHVWTTHAHNMLIAAFQS